MGTGRGRGDYRGVGNLTLARTSLPAAETNHSMQQQQQQKEAERSPTNILNGQDRISNDNSPGTPVFVSPKSMAGSEARCIGMVTETGVGAGRGRGTEGSAIARSSVCSADGSTDGEDQEEEEAMSGSSSTGSEHGDGDEEGDGEGFSETVSKGEDAIDHLFAELMTEDIHEGGLAAVEAGGLAVGGEDELLMFYSNGDGGQPFAAPVVATALNAVIAI